MSLETQTPYLWIIFGRKNSPLIKDFNYYYEKLSAWCSVNARLWTFIGHDKDIDDDGELKFRHIHALIVLKEGQKPRLSTSLNRLATHLGIDSVDIDIEKAENIASCIRYCLHKGYPTKYQYSLEDLKTNLTEDEIAPYLDIEDKSFTASYLINLVQICNCSTITILKQIGLKNYIRYRNVIMDIIREIKCPY